MRSGCLHEVNLACVPRPGPGSHMPEAAALLAATSKCLAQSRDRAGGPRKLVECRHSSGGSNVESRSARLL